MREEFHSFDQRSKSKNRLGTGARIALALIAWPLVVFLAYAAMWVLVGINMSNSAKEATEISPEVQALLPLNQEFLDAATSRQLSAGLGGFGDWVGSVSWETGVLGCPTPYLVENNSPDSCMMTSTEQNYTPSSNEMCSKFIDYAKKLGATKQISVIYPQSKPISDSSVEDCEKTLNSELRSASYALFSPRFILFGDFKPNIPMAVGLSHGLFDPKAAAVDSNSGSTKPYSGSAVLQPLVDKYDITVATTFDQKIISVERSAFADGQNHTAALLDLIAFYRKVNQHNDPRSEIFIDAVIEDFKERYGFSGTWEPYVTADGEANWVQVTRADGYRVCVAIERKNSSNKNINEQPADSDLHGNESFVGNGDINWGMPGAQGEHLQGVGREIKNMSSDYYFGDYIVGKCG